MQKNQTLSPGSSRTPISTSLSNMENPQTYFHANGTDRIKSEPNIRPLEANTIYESGGTSASESKVKSRKKIKMHRFAFQTRSQVDILDDGYRWRKYGQKAVKDSKFPRSYYRCTQKGCNVKKQIQRLTQDEEMVVTTYEGMHTHPLENAADSFEQIFRQIRKYAPL